MDSVRQTCIELVCDTCTVKSVRDTFHRVNIELDEKYGSVYDNINKCLSEGEQLRGETNRLGSLTRVLDDLFSDNIYNWGRVVTAMIWARKICGTKEAGEIVSNKVAFWIHSNGGFEAFVKFFRQSMFPNILGDVALTVIGISSAFAFWWFF